MIAYNIGFVKHKSERRMSSKVLLFYTLRALKSYEANY